MNAWPGLNSDCLQKSTLTADPASSDRFGTVSVIAGQL